MAKKIFLVIILIIFLTSCNLPQSNGQIGCDVEELIDAIIDANSTPDTEDTINLATDCIYELSMPIADISIQRAMNGLPSITSPIVINGNGSVITRAPDQSTHQFRFIYITTEGALTLSDIKIEKGDASGGSGGAIFNKGALSLSNSTFRNNTAQFGGAIFSFGIISVTNSTFTENIAANGGAISINLDAEEISTITNSVFTNNYAELMGLTGSGGAITNGSHSHYLAEGPTIYINGCTFSGNVARDGGAVSSSNRTNTVIQNSSFTENSALMGGAISNGYRLEVISTTINNNYGREGGGIYSYKHHSLTDQSSLLVVNSTISGNMSVDPNRRYTSISHGVGIYIGKHLAASDNHDNRIIHTTITNHETAHDPGAIYVGDGCSIEIENSIIANNPVGDCGAESTGSISSSGANLDSDGSCPGFSFTADPKLEPLADNGGPTLTHALSYLSPAIDAALDYCPPTDQRDEPRPYGAGCDLGAFEFFMVEPHIPGPEDLLPTPTSTSEKIPVPNPMILELTLCWLGPGPPYEVVSSLQPNTPVEVLGTGSGGGYIVINHPKHNLACWVKEGVISLDGLNISYMPTFEIPPQPIPSVEPTNTPQIGCLVQKNLSEAPKCVIPCPDPETYTSPCSP